MKKDFLNNIQFVDGLFEKLNNPKFYQGNKLKTNFEDISIFPKMTELYEEIIKKEDEVIIKKCIDIGIDPKILVNQLNEINRLNDVIDSLEILIDELREQGSEYMNKCHKLEIALMNACKYLKKAGVVYDKKNGKPIRLSKENWYIRLMEDSNE